MKSSFYLSLGLHLLLLSFLVVPNCGGKSNEEQEKNANNSDNQEIVPKGQDVPSSPQEITLIIGHPKSTKGEDCPNGRWYGGIGVEHNVLDQTIQTVVAGYPAEKSGIKIGDVVLGDLEKIKGEPGTPVTIWVRRGIQILRFDMLRDKICIK